MSYVIRFAILPHSTAYSAASHAYVAKGGHHFPWRSGTPLLGRDGRTIVQPIALDAAHHFATRAEAAKALGDIVAAVWSGEGRWIDAPVIMKAPPAYHCDDCDFSTNDRDVTRCPDSQCRGNVG
jgi:hypothetical protein